MAAEVLEVLIVRCGDGDLVVKTQPGGGPRAERYFIACPKMALCVG